MKVVFNIYFWGQSFLLSLLILLIFHLTTLTTFAQQGGDFSFTLSSTTTTINPGSTASFSINLTATGGFNNIVNFSTNAGSGIIANVSPNFARPPATLNLSIGVGPGVNPGNYSVTVTATALGASNKSQTLNVTVPQPSLNLSVSPGSLQVVAGSTAEFNINISGNSTSAVALAANSQLNVSIVRNLLNPPDNTKLIVVVPKDTPPRIYSITVNATTANGSFNQTVSVNLDVKAPPDYNISINPSSISLVAGESKQLFVNVTANNGFNDTVRLAVADGVLNVSFSTNTITGSGTATLFINSNANTPSGDYNIVVAGSSGTIQSGIIERTAIARVTVTRPVDFSLVTTPSVINSNPGKTVSFTVSVAADGNFTDTVALMINSTNSNITTNTSTNNVSLGSSANVTINIGINTQIGNYDISVVGTSKGLQKTVLVRLIVTSLGDFELRVLPDKQEIMAGESASFVVNTMGQMGFAERITLSANANGLQNSFSSTTIDATSTSTLTINTTKETEAKDYVVTITANGGGITKTATATLTIKPALIEDFTLVTTPDIQTISAGKSTSFTLAINPVNGFNDPVNLTAEVPEGSIQVVFSNKTARPGDNISATVITTGNTPPQNYSIRIIGASGSLVKTALFGLNVTPQVQEAFSLALAPNLQSIANGESTMFTIGVVGRDGFNQAVSLSADSPDPTIQLNFDNATINAGSNTFITVVTSSNTQPGTYTILITGRAGSLTVSQPVILAVRQAVLKVDISFEAPPEGQIAPPQNVKVVANELKTSQAQTLLTKKIRPLADGDLAGFKIYRLPTPAEGQPALTAEDLVKDENLIETLPNDTTTFTDNVPVGQSSTGNFTYSVTSFFGNGQNSNGSNPAGTELPVIRNPKFIKGTIFLDSASSFINTTGATIIINGIDEYPLMLTSEATQFTVDKKITSLPSSITLKKLIKKGQTVELIVKNKDGKLSVAKSLTRPKKK